MKSVVLSLILVSQAAFANSPIVNGRVATNPGPIVNGIMAPAPTPDFYTMKCLSARPARVTYAVTINKETHQAMGIMAPNGGTPNFPKFTSIEVSVVETHELIRNSLFSKARGVESQYGRAIKVPGKSSSMELRLPFVFAFNKKIPAILNLDLARGQRVVENVTCIAARK